MIIPLEYLDNFDIDNDTDWSNEGPVEFRLLQPTSIDYESRLTGTRLNELQQTSIDALFREVYGQHIREHVNYLVSELVSNTRESDGKE